MLNNSFIKVACINPIVEVGDPIKNSQEIIRVLALSKASINLFPELCVTGYCCQDLFFQETLLKENYQAIDYIVKNNPSKGIVIIGAPLLLTGSLFNCAIVILGHEILGVIPKTYLPNYREFQEKRWFQQGKDTTERAIVINGKAYPFGNIVFKDYENQLFFGIEICEDMWCPVTPGSFLSLGGANMIFNLSSSNEYFRKDIIRHTCVLDNSRRNDVAYIYTSSGATESTEATVFSGHNIVCSCGETLLNHLSFATKSQIDYVDIDYGSINYHRKTSTNLHVALPKDYFYHTIKFSLPQTPFNFEHKPNSLPFVPNDCYEDFKRISNILEHALYKRMLTTKLDTLIIGVSGGLDSTLALLVAYNTFKLLGKDVKKIIGVTMPGLGTSDRTKNNALDLMKHLGITVLNKPINDEVLAHFKLIDHDPLVTDITYENTQARYRTLILMNLANEHNGLVLGTGDMSELALGWCTYNGDQMSMYGINAGLPKTLVRYMVHAYGKYEFKDVSSILEDICITPISPELKANQKTEDTVGKYEINDFILYRYLFNGDDKEKICFLLRTVFTLDEITAKQFVDNFYHRFFTQQFKRSSLPDGPKVLAYSLGSRSDYRMPSDLSRR